MNLLVLAQGLDGYSRQRLGHVQQPGAVLHQLGLRHVDVPLVGLLAQGVGHAGRHPLRRIRGNAQVAGDLVGGDEADAVDVARQPVGVVVDHAGRAVAVVLVDAHGQRRADAVALQEDHHLADLALLVPGGLDLADPLGADAQHLVQPLRRFVDHGQGISAELAHDAFGRHRANALDQPAAQVFLDARGRGRQHRGVALDLELPAVLAVDRPLPLQAHVLAHLHAEHVADHRRLVVLAVRDQAGDGVAVLLVVKGDALDGAFQGGHGERVRGRLVIGDWYSGRWVASGQTARPAYQYTTLPTYHRLTAPASAQ